MKYGHHSCEREALKLHWKVILDFQTSQTFLMVTNDYLDQSTDIIPYLIHESEYLIVSQILCYN
jgi:hypothetical protein